MALFILYYLISIIEKDDLHHQNNLINYCIVLFDFVISLHEYKLILTTMKAKITLSDFNFSFAGYGHYKVTYTSPVTRKSWTCTTNDMPLIDDTKNSENPKQRDLNALKWLCKRCRANN